MGKTQLNHTATLSIHQWLYVKTLTYCHQELWSVTEKNDFAVSSSPKEFPLRLSCCSFARKWASWGVLYIWLRCLLGASLRRASMRVQLGGDNGVDPEFWKCFRIHESRKILARWTPRAPAYPFCTSPDSTWKKIKRWMDAANHYYFSKWALLSTYCVLSDLSVTCKHTTNACYSTSES